MRIAAFGCYLRASKKASGQAHRAESAHEEDLMELGTDEVGVEQPKCTWAV